MTLSINYAGYQCVDPVTEYSEQKQAGIDTSSWENKAISYTCPLGAEPGRAWFLLLKKDLDKVDINTPDFLVFKEDGQEMSIGPLLIIKAICLTPGKTASATTVADPNSCYLVEAVDRRWLARNIPLDLQVNIISPDSEPVLANHSYYPLTMDQDNGGPYTWVNLIKKIWKENGKLGTFPGMPFDPKGNPENFNFIGVDSYEILNILLAKLSCALRYDPINDKFSIVQLGVDATLDDIEKELRPFLINDLMPVESLKAKVPAKVRIYYNVIQTMYGQENTTVNNEKQWVLKSFHIQTYDAHAYGIDPTLLEEDNTQIFWEDLKARVDKDYNILNQDEIDQRGGDVAARFYQAILDGSERLLKIYTGIQGSFLPNGRLKYVSWKLTKDGYFTEIARYPGYVTVHNTQNIGVWDNLGKLESLLPPDFSRSTHPLYFPQIQYIRIESDQLYNKRFYDATLHIFYPELNESKEVAKVWLGQYDKDHMSESIKYKEGDRVFGKIFGYGDMGGGSRQIYISDKSEDECCMALVKVTGGSPVMELGDFYFYNGKIVEIEKTVDGGIKKVDLDTPAIYVALDKRRFPELNLTYIGKKAITPKGFPETALGQDRDIYYVVPEYVRLLRITSEKPVADDYYPANIFGIDFDENKFFNITGSLELGYAKNLRQIKGGDYKLWTDIFYIGRFLGFTDLPGELLPAYAIDPDYVTTKTTAGDIEGLKRTRTLTFDNDNFDVLDKGGGEALIEGRLLLYQGGALPRKKKLNFIKYPYLINNPPNVDLVFNEGDMTICRLPFPYVIFPPDIDGNGVITFIKGIYPIIVDISLTGVATVSLSTPLEVIYGGTQRDFLNQDAVILGNGIAPVQMIGPGPIFSVFNQRTYVVESDEITITATTPEWATWPIIDEAVQIGADLASTGLSSTGTLFLNYESSGGMFGQRSGKIDTGQVLFWPDTKPSQKNVLWVDKVDNIIIAGVNYDRLNSKWTNSAYPLTVLWFDPSSGDIKFYDYPNVRGIQLGTVGAITGEAIFDSAATDKTFKFKGNAYEKTTINLLQANTPPSDNSWIHAKSYDAGSGVIEWEWKDLNDGLFWVTLNFVTNVCCVKNGMGYLTDIIVERRQLTIPVLHGLIGDPECTTCPSNCCSGGGGGTGVLVGCCSPIAVPENLFVTIDHHTPGCECLSAAAVPINWDGAQWAGSSVSDTCGGAPVSITLSCDGTGVWHLSISSCGGEVVLLSTSCSPFMLVSEDIICPAKCTGTFSLVVTG